jgi:hypothetical protein
MFGDVLGIDGVGAFDNFFELGGDSLRGAQVVARINSETRAGLDVASLFRCPTVAELASALSAAPPIVGDSPDAQPIRPASRRDYRPDVSDAAPSG